MKTYSEYRDSGIKWIGQTPKHWVITRVGRLMFLGRGRVISHLEIADNPGEYPVYSSQTANDGIMGHINTYDFEGDYITWTTDGANAGTVFHRSGQFNCTNVCGTMQPKKNQVYLRYFPYLLNLGTKSHVRYDINPKLMNNEMSQIKICLPPYQEQKKIADYLDRKTMQIDEVIEKKKKLIDLLKEYRAAIITHAVTKGLDPNVPKKDSGIEWLGKIQEHWSIKRLKYVANINPSKQYSTIKKNSDEMVVFLPMESVSVNGTYNDSQRKKLKELWKGFTYFEKDDVIFAKITPCFENGKSAYLKNLSTGIGFGSTEFHILRAYKGFILPEYLHYIVRSSFFRIIGEASMYGAAGQKRVPDDFVRNFTVPLPSISEQNAIIEHLNDHFERLGKAIESNQRMISFLQEYRKTLISATVTGKIDVRDEYKNRKKAKKEH